MKNTSLFIRDVFNLIRNKFPEFSKIPIGLNITDYNGRDKQYIPSYVEFSIDGNMSDIDNINISIINDFSKLITVLDDLSLYGQHNSEYTYGYEKRDLDLIWNINEKLTEEILIVLLLLNSFGTIHCMVKFKELLNFKDFENLIVTTSAQLRVSRGFNKPYPIYEQTEIEDNFLFTNLHALLFKYQHFIEVWNDVKLNIMSKTPDIVFEIGKYYMHTTGEKLYILGKIDANLFGDYQLAARSNKSQDLKVVGSDESCTANWYEITEEEWKKDYGKHNK